MDNRSFIIIEAVEGLQIKVASHSSQTLRDIVAAESRTNQT